MTLGQKINQLRTAKHLSQGDLADILKVSRQSISKWETDGSVPDLDNLIKLSQIFGVTLDELILNKTPDAAPGPAATAPLTEETSPTASDSPAYSGTPVRIIIGGVLLICAFLCMILGVLLGDLAAGLLLSSPFLICMLVCFIVKKHTGLACFWVVSVLSDIFMRWGTGINWHLASAWIILPQYEYGIAHLIISVIETLWLWTLILITIRRFRRGRTLELKPLMLLWGAGLLFRFSCGRLLIWMFSNLVLANAIIFVAAQCLTDWLQVSIFTVLLIYTLRHWCQRKGAIK